MLYGHYTVAGEVIEHYWMENGSHQGAAQGKFCCEVKWATGVLAPKVLEDLGLDTY